MTSNYTDSPASATYHIAAFYRFTPLPNYQDLQIPLKEKCLELDICGLILLAEEGINGTIAGSKDNLQKIMTHINGIFGVPEYKFSTADEVPFFRMKVRLKKEIIRMDVDDLQPATHCGKHVEAEDWNDLISSDDVVLIDTRNDYETAIGQFQGAIDPNCKKFSDFPAFVEKYRSELQGKKIAMYCTGGIRCEKASAYMLQAGFEDVYQLKGGILKYLENVPKKDSKWNGGCFVFDRRVAVGHGLSETDFGFCAGCRGATSAEDRLHPHYQEGISCPRCFSELTEDRKQRFAERQKQIQLAKKRGKRHMGA